MSTPSALGGFESPEHSRTDPQDHGWMYSRSFQDPDGHIWELLYMDESKLPTSPDK